MKLFMINDLNRTIIIVNNIETMFVSGKIIFD